MLTTVQILRLDRGMTPAAVARKAGLPVARYRAIEDGRAIPDHAEVDAIAYALEVRWDELLRARRLVVDVVPPRSAIAGPATDATGVMAEPTATAIPARRRVRRHYEPPTAPEAAKGR